MKKINNITRKQLEKRGYMILEVLNIYNDCIEYKVCTTGGYTKNVRVFEDK